MRFSLLLFLFPGLLNFRSAKAITAAHHNPAKNSQPNSCNRRSPGTSLVVTNYCSDTIYPGIVTQGGQGPSPSGFELQPGSSQRLGVSKDWQGRVWARTNCSFNADGTGPATAGGVNGAGKACGTGDCNGVVNCVVTGDTPVSLAEFTMDAGDGHTYYDISLVDGYNLPLAIVLLPDARGRNKTFDEIPPNLTNPSCVASISNLAPQGFNPYGQGEFLGTNASFPLPFDEQVTESQVEAWCPWNLQVIGASEPVDGIYIYPDGNLERPAFDPCYSACAKFNLPQDCCTGAYGTPSTCEPSQYSRAAKAVCPDAYSYGNVSFCPENNPIC